MSVSIQEQPQNNERIRNNRIFRADSNQIRAVDGKQIWSGLINHELILNCIT